MPGLSGLDLVGQLHTAKPELPIILMRCRSGLLDGRQPAVQGQLGQELKAAAQPRWARVDLRGVQVERVRDFGQVYLALFLWRRFGLHTLLRELLDSGREEVPWELTACVWTLARFCDQKSELEVAQRWYADIALEDLLGVGFGQINDARLCRGLDVLHEHEEQLRQHLLNRYQSWFGVQFEFLLYDVPASCRWVLETRVPARIVSTPPNLKSLMTTKTLEIVLDDRKNSEYPNCYAPIPPNGKVCPHTGLRHTHLYTMLAAGGTARPHVRVVNLREPGAKKGKTLFHVGDFLRHLDRLAAQQGSGTLRNAHTDEGASE